MSNPSDPADATKVVPAGTPKNNRQHGYTYIEFHVNELADRRVP